MNYDDLSVLPNFSPMDVVAVLKQQDRGEIYGTFQLKNSPGISYYGYKNLLDFVSFDDERRAILICFYFQIHLTFTCMIFCPYSISRVNRKSRPTLL